MESSQRGTKEVVYLVRLRTTGKTKLVHHPLEYKTKGKAWTNHSDMPEALRVSIPAALLEPSNYTLSEENNRLITLTVTVSRPITRQAVWLRAKQSAITNSKSEGESHGKH